MAETNKAQKRKKIVVRPHMQVRLRCQEDHGDPWMTGLTVIWAPVPPPADGADASSSEAPAPKPKFSLCKTDHDGYLSPPADGDADWIDSHKLLADVEYLFYFIRHPDPSNAYALQMLDAIQRGSKEYGEPHRLKSQLEQTGKNKSKKCIKELVFRIPESPDAFLPPGDDFYGGWFLFRDMPNASCPPILKQVGRLQHHLGSLRYIVGKDNPYRPSHKSAHLGREPVATRKKPEAVYCELGAYDTFVWNAVLAFQRHVVDGNAFKLKTNPHDKNVPGYEWVNLSLKPKLELEFDLDVSREYLVGEKADSSDATLDDVVISGRVDPPTAKAIKQWLDKSLRKPDNILVARSALKDGGMLCWVRDDAASAMDEWNAKVVSLGFTWGIYTPNTFRSAERDVGGASYGRAKLSIHKTGLAVDLMNHNHWTPHEQFPVEKVMVHETVYGQDRIRWKLYALVPRPKDMNSIPRKLYEEQIQPWIYDNLSTEGGLARSTHSGPAGQNLAEHHGSRRRSRLLSDPRLC